MFTNRNLLFKNWMFKQRNISYHCKDFRVRPNKESKPSILALNLNLQ